MRIALAGLLVLGLAATASANGRDPYTSTITWRRGNSQHIVAGMTFGLVISKDGGATWQWMCERAVGYGGMYDPDYVYTASGAIFATTFDGLKVMRDGCSFVSTPPGMTFVSKTEDGSDGALYYAAADPNDSKIYKSTDDGVTFPPGMATTPAGSQAGDWWSSFSVAPSNAQRLYLTGYRLDGMNPKVFLLYTSNNGGTSWTAMTMTGITPVSPNSVVEIVSVSPTADQTVYVKVTFENGSSGDSIYRSTNAGQTWTKILSKDSNFGLAFVARADGTCVAGTREQGSWKNTRATATPANWTEIAGAPHIGCLYEHDGVVWACTQNYASPQLNIPSDEFGIMKSTDLVTWTGVLKYQDIQAPVPCAAGTVQEDQCVQRYMDQSSQWCCLKTQLGITSESIDCNGALACFGMMVDGAPDAGTVVMPRPKETCCGAGNGKSSALLSLLVAGALLFRRRRPKER
jgi:MYXO-CTERM domain-containing protein